MKRTGASRRVAQPGRVRPTVPRAVRREPMARRLSAAERVLDVADEASVLDLLDHVLHKGVVLSGDLTIGLAQVDLIYARLSVLLCAVERVVPVRRPDAPPARRRRGPGR
jgi:gas vesicle structural protein